MSLTAQTPKDCELKLNGFIGVDEEDAISGCAVWGNGDDGMNVGVGSGNCEVGAKLGAMLGAKLGVGSGNCEVGAKLGVGWGVDSRSVGCGANGCGFNASPGNCWNCGYINEKINKHQTEQLLLLSYSRHDLIEFNSTIRFNFFPLCLIEAKKSKNFVFITFSFLLKKISLILLVYIEYFYLFMIQFCSF